MAEKTRTKRSLDQDSCSAASGRKPLESLLLWAQEAIEEFADDDCEVVKTEIKPNSRMSAGERMLIYSRSYYARLSDALKSDFDATSWVVGDDKWRELTDDYARAYPSKHPNLNHYGAHFVEFLHDCDLPNSEFLTELARLEWTIAEVFDRKDGAGSISKEALARIAPEDFERIVLKARPSLELMQFSYPVNRFLQSYYDGEEPKVPTQKSHTWLQVYRKDYRVWRLSLTQPRYELMREIVSGAALGDSVQSVSEHSEIPDEDFAADVQNWFADWMSDGIFSDIELRS